MTPRIVGGTEVPADTFPYPFATSLESFGFQICGASLIAPQWILTAAHCVDASAAPSQYSAYLHGFHLGVYTHECSERLQAIQIVCHEDFDKASTLCVTSAAPRQHPPSAPCAPSSVQHPLALRHLRVNAHPHLALQGTLRADVCLLMLQRPARCGAALKARGRCRGSTASLASRWRGPTRR